MLQQALFEYVESAQNEILHRLIVDKYARRYLTPVNLNPKFHASKMLGLQQKLCLSSTLSHEKGELAYNFIKMPIGLLYTLIMGFYFKGFSRPLIF